MTWPSDRTTLRNSGQKSRMTARLTIHSTRRYDDDNLQGCQKSVLDALKNLGYIRDDSSNGSSCATRFIRPPRAKLSARKFRFFRIAKRSR
jgi:Holliday junction resolvase RusA-like endonuclease